MILVVSKSKRSSERLVESFNALGYLAYGTTVPGALSELSPRYRAVIIISDGTPAAFDAVIKCAASFVLRIPVFALGNFDETKVLEIFREGASANFIIKRIIRYLVINEMHIIGKYKCAGFDASADIGRVLYFDKEIPLTKTEKMILRFLTRTYPLPQRAEDIIKYALPPSRSPEPSSIRNHISTMNKKFVNVIGMPMIEFYNKKGYILITPERKILK